MKRKHLEPGDVIALGMHGKYEIQIIVSICPHGVDRFTYVYVGSSGPDRWIGTLYTGEQGVVHHNGVRTAWKLINHE